MSASGGGRCGAMLDDRKLDVLRAIVEDYVSTNEPVGSKSLVERHHLGVSPATVRNDMATLEEDGYITQPHTSAGRVPTDKGYRYYVESLMSEDVIPLVERETIRHQFHQAEHAMEQRFQLAAAVLAHSVSNFAVVTSPRSKETRLRHVQLVPMQDTSALCVVVLNEARIRQQVMSFSAFVEQALTVAAAKVSERLTGMSPSEIRAQPEPASEAEALITRSVIELMDQEEVALGEVFRDGVREVLSQPEFARSERILDLIDVLEQRTLATAIPNRIAFEGINVVIGAENSL